MTRFLTVEEVINLHDLMDGAALLDRGKLEGAVLRPQSSFGAVFLHPTIYEQASVMLHGITQAYAFADANKRTAWVATITFLELNGVRINDLDPTYWSDYMVEVAMHVHTEEDTAFWFAALDPKNGRLL
ncbi:type II toxin-antitoxin system death-on-curing family toxin [Rathayibacter agropyri]|uniref:type II toxin-antitoxin system death-on-curing family toxin n=1 Tax=Rathayibacter agropyri TaxID=1634927 RepID=UPI0015643DA8|nr:type II toxin-antitoxin system death-on-curing family toxin [Rathayibacter agropyri]